MMDTLQKQIARKWKIPSISDLEICGQFPFAQILARENHIHEPIQDLLQERIKQRKATGS